MDVYLLDKVWIFPAIMAGSFLVILFFGKRFSERVTSGIGILAVTICFLLSLVVAMSPDIITLTDLHSGRYVMVNDSFCRVLGRSLDEVIGRTTLQPSSASTGKAKPALR